MRLRQVRRPKATQTEATASTPTAAPWFNPAGLHAAMQAIEGQLRMGGYPPPSPPPRRPPWWLRLWNAVTAFFLAYVRVSDPEWHRTVRHTAGTLLMWSFVLTALVIFGKALLWVILL